MQAKSESGWVYPAFGICILIFTVLLLLGYFQFTSSCKLPTDIQQRAIETENFNNQQKDSTCVLYYAMWCGYSRSFLPEWEKFEKYCAANMPSCATKRVRCEDGMEAECNQKGVKGYPTVIFEKKNGENVVFDGDRSVEALVAFCKKNMA